MNYGFFEKFSFLSCLLLMTLCCWNGTLVESTNSNKRPDVNFYGTIEDHYKTFNAEDILIGGKYEVIPVYQGVNKKKQSIEDKDQKQEIDPKQNKALIDMQEVKSIELKHPDHPSASQISINNRDYVEIIVTSINGTKKTYLIESSRKITCREIDKGPDGQQTAVHEERELNMIHLKKLTIKGYKSTKDVPEKKYYEKDAKQYESQVKKNDEKKEIAQNTGDLLNKIEENVKTLSQDNPSTFEKAKSSIVSMLKALREQLQKMLNMLQ